MMGIVAAVAVSACFVRLLLLSEPHLSDPILRCHSPMSALPLVNILLAVHETSSAQ